ncbi:hypothetical protein ACJJIK_15305 [Microbulbifer sp. ZKSA006]|uniref:hypothetical protein n=1 Tax=Microbulbifer sp. ZKSA006 TaxID=3243390 RepID=UPI004038FD11
MKSINDISLVDLKLGNDWKITHNEFYNIEPKEVDNYKDSKYPIWSMFFIEDLMQIENSKKELLIDVGWYPDGDKAGMYRLILIKSIEGSFDWDSPIDTYETRVLKELINKIDSLVSQ